MDVKEASINEYFVYVPMITASAIFEICEMMSWKYLDQDQPFIAKINSYFNRPSDVIVAKYLSFILSKFKTQSGWYERIDSFS